MFRVAVVEDNPSDAEILCSILDQYAVEQRIQFQTILYPNPLDFLESYCSGYDIVFLDIEMPGIDGINTAKQLCEIDEDVILIFVTNMAQYALHGYEVNALDYVLKPLNYHTFALKLKKALKRLNRRKFPMVELNTTDGYVRVPASTVMYIEVANHYLTYHTENASYKVRASMKTAETQLCPFHFVRCNNCYLINLLHVTGVQDNIVFIGQTPLQISRPRRTAFLRALANYMGGSV